MATIVDVAREAGVSTSTVSHVLNGTRRVEPATRRRVLAAIKATSYRQDALARAMRRSRTDTIGLVVSDAGEPAFLEMVHGIERAAADAGLTLFLANSNEDAELEMRAVRALVERRVDGLILARAAASTEAVMDYIATGSSPVVLLDRIYPAIALDQVGVDNRSAMHRLVSHLQASGHSKFLLAAGDTRVPTLVERREGFLDAFEGSDRRNQHVVEGSDLDALEERVRRAIERGDTSCVISGSTPLAVACLHVLKKLGLRTPNDIAFATFDGFAHSDLFEPSITTVHQPAYELGVTAVDLLRRRISRPDGSPQTIRLTPTLELRSSTEGFGAGKGITFS